MTTNGILRSTEHPELSEPTITNTESHSLRALCDNLDQKIESFLEKDLEEPRLRAVQAQCRHSLAIIREALDRYP